MINHSSAELTKLVLHKIGNKINLVENVLSNELKDLNDEEYEIMLPFFLKPFESVKEYQKFTHYSDINLNALYKYSSELFDNQDNFLEVSMKIAIHLFEQSNHPQIKLGDLFVVYFEDIQCDDLITDGIGIFKIERKSNFIRTFEVNGQNNFDLQIGINVQKLDKACLILLSNNEDRFKVLSIDNNDYDANYWKNDFLGIEPILDDYHFTKSYLTITQKFINQELVDDSINSKAAKVDLLNKTVEYFKTNDTFQEDDFTDVVFNNPSISDSFRSYKETYINENNLELSDDFFISSEAVKSQSKAIKRILKLDKNFDVYIHGDGNLIEKGFDSKKGKSYYKIYFDVER